MRCTNCGVELEPEHKLCPLCGYPPGTAAREPREYQPLPQRAERLNVLRLVRRIGVALWLWVSMVVILIGGVVPGDVRWVWITVGSVSAALGIHLSLLTIRRGAVLLIFVIAIVAALLLLLDWIVESQLNWFVPVGLPVLAALAGLLLLGNLAFRGLPTALGIAATIAVAGAVTLAVDAAVSAFRSGASSLTWSVVVVLAAFPSALGVALLHWMVLRHIDLRRHFHL